MWSSSWGLRVKGLGYKAGGLGLWDKDVVLEGPWMAGSN